MGFKVHVERLESGPKAHKGVAGWLYESSAIVVS